MTLLTVRRIVTAKSVITVDPINQSPGPLHDLSKPSNMSVYDTGSALGSVILITPGASEDNPAGQILV